MTWPPWRVPLKYKVLALAVGPLLLAMSIALSRVAHHSAELTEAQSRILEEQLLVAKQLELRSYVGLALSALAPLYAEEDGEAARSRAKAILTSTRYGEDGYFFAYDQRGVCLVHPTMPELVGRDVREVVDSRGRHVVPDLIKLAKEGGGFQRYSWPKPSRHEPVEKLSYVTVLPRWGWVVGTGVYMDDVERTGYALRARARSSVERTLRSVGLVAVSSVALVFIAGVILNTSQQRLADGKLKAMAQRIVLLQEEERAYVSRHLHDGVSQVLVAAKLQLESAARALAASPVGSPRELALGLEQLSEAIVAVRDVSHELRPLELDRLGLSGALRQLADEFAARSGLSVSFEDDSAGASLGEEASVALFRIVQEALANVTRHARASSVEVRLSARANALCLSLVDDGCGFDVAQVAQSPRGGIGLRNVRERVEHLGGHFTVRSKPGHTELEVRLPTSPRRS